MRRTKYTVTFDVLTDKSDEEVGDAVRRGLFVGLDTNKVANPNQVRHIKVDVVERMKQAYIVVAKSVTYHKIEIEAESTEEAWREAENTDGGEFIADEETSSWDVLEPRLKEDADV